MASSAPAGKTIGKLKTPTGRAVKLHRGEMICRGIFDFLSVCMFLTKCQKN